MEIIKIGALWCPGCLILNNTINSIKKNYPEVNVIEYDYDFDNEVKDYNVGNVLPVLIFFKNGKEVSRLVGEKSHEEIISEMERIL